MLLMIIQHHSLVGKEVSVQGKCALVADFSFANMYNIICFLSPFTGEAIHLRVQVLVLQAFIVQRQRLQFIVLSGITVLAVATHIRYHAIQDHTVMLKA